MISYSLDVNILVRNNAPKKRLFDPTISAIEHYQPIQRLIPIELRFFWLNGLSPLVSPSIDLNYTKSESYSDYCNMHREDNEVFWIEQMPLTNPNYTKINSYNDICSKNHPNISDRIGIYQLLLNNSKSPINNCNTGKVDDEVTLIEKM